jgi:hypothetical protein
MVGGLAIGPFWFLARRTRADDRALRAPEFDRDHDTETGQQRELLTSAETFDYECWGVAESPMDRVRRVPSWGAGDDLSLGWSIRRFQSQPGSSSIDSRVTPSGSADGTMLYYMARGTVARVRSVVRGRRFGSETGWFDEPMTVYGLSELLMPAYIPGTAPIATPDQIILVPVISEVTYG